MRSIPSARLLLTAPPGAQGGIHPVQAGMPLPQGFARTRGDLRLLNHEGHPLPCDLDPLSTWHDGSFKWVRLRLLVHWQTGETERELRLVSTEGLVPPSPASSFLVEEKEEEIRVDTGTALFVVDRRRFFPFRQVTVAHQDLLRAGGNAPVLLRNARGGKYRLHLEEMRTEYAGRLWHGLEWRGSFKNAWGLRFCRAYGRIAFFANTALCRLEISLWNAGEGRSRYFRSITVPFRLSNQQTWRATLSSTPSPALWMDGGEFQAAFALEEFWQRVPGRLSMTEGEARVEPFPHVDRQKFEMQGGERMTFAMWTDFAPAEHSASEALPAARLSLIAAPDPHWTAATRAVPYLIPFEKPGDPPPVSLLPSAWDEKDDLAHSFFHRFLQSSDARWHGLGREWARRAMERGDVPTAFNRYPSDEYPFTPGLALYHLLSGDPSPKQSVLDWARRVESRRDGGYSVNACLDAFILSGDRRWLNSAEEFIATGIHPHDEPEAMGLLRGENQWSYLVFLQVLGRYLEEKRGMREYDAPFWYARTALTNYVHWMARRESPYLDKPEELKNAGSTWTAQDFRKAAVFALAARFGPAEEAAVFSERAAFFLRRARADLRKHDDKATVRNPAAMLFCLPVLEAWENDDNWNLSLVPPRRLTFPPRRERKTQKIPAMERAKRILRTGG